jgi:ADP-heptose:LPS heptosyltransferase
LISAFTGKANISKDEIKNLYGFTKPELENPELLDLLNTPKTKVILHPLSQGSAMEWGLKNFNELAHYLEQKDCRVYIAGTKKEGSKIVQNIDFGNDIIDLTGKMSLVEYISFIGCCDALVAASTGPLHIAAALNLFAIGLYSCKRPIHPERWAPIGKNAEYIETKKSDDSLESISVNQVAEKLLKGLR